jgi:hypothetical protein
MAGNREYKSDVFSMLMEDKRNALQVYNINKGMNKELLAKCQMLREYMIFVDYTFERQIELEREAYDGSRIQDPGNDIVPDDKPLIRESKLQLLPMK